LKQILESNMHHQGNLTVNSDNLEYAQTLASVGGYLAIRAEARLPLLERVGGDLRIYASADANLPLLESVGGDLRIYASADANLPLLESVGCDLTIYASAEARLPLLESVGGDLRIYADANLPVLENVGGYLAIDADANLPVLGSAHGKPGRLIAVHDYGLWQADDGAYSAGCRGPLTKAQALSHWDRGDDRALLFTLAIAFCN
jgi:hypothetical protein